MAGFDLRRLAVTLVSVWSVAGCGAVYDPQGFWNTASFWQDGAASDQALAELSKGNFLAAEHFSKEALRRNPNDPYALLAAGIVYQNTNRPGLARQYYESILALGPKATVTIGGNTPYASRSVSDVARANLAQLTPLPQVSVDPVARQEAMDLALATRFVTLKRLYDERMITEEEFRSRRTANIGALLPYTSASPAAAGLDLPAPPSDQVLERLRDLNKSLEIKAITPREHADERKAILDALLPPVPRSLASLPQQPKDAAQAAQISARLEKYKAMKLITADEAAREQAAVARAVQVATEPAVTATPLAPATPVAAPAKGVAVHLASLASEVAAEKEWTGLQAKFPQLRELSPAISRTDLGKKGVYYRLKAGPLASKSAAAKLCKELKAKKQFCQVARLDGK